MKKLYAILIVVLACFWFLSGCDAGCFDDDIPGIVLITLRAPRFALNVNAIPPYIGVTFVVAATDDWWATVPEDMWLLLSLIIERYYDGGWTEVYRAEVHSGFARNLGSEWSLLITDYNIPMRQWDIPTCSSFAHTMNYFDASVVGRYRAVVRCRENAQEWWASFTIVDELDSPVS